MVALHFTYPFVLNNASFHLKPMIIMALMS